MDVCPGPREGLLDGLPDVGHVVHGLGRPEQAVHTVWHHDVRPDLEAPFLAGTVEVTEERAAVGVVLEQACAGR